MVTLLDSNSPHTYIRFFNSLVIDFPLLFYCDEQLLFKKIDYDFFSRYVEVPSGNHTLSLLNGLTKEILLEKRVNLRPYSIFTYTLNAKSSQLIKAHQLYSLEENFRLCAPDKAFLRFHHFSPTAPMLSFYLNDSELLYKSMRYGESSKYLPISLKRQSIELKHFDTSTSFLTLPSFQFKSGRFYSFYLIGSSLSSNMPYKISPCIDGNSFLKNKKPLH